MKKKIQQYLAASVFSLIALVASGQNQPRKPSWVSDKGYWVVESNIHNPLQHTVRFYNNDKMMIGQKQVSGMKLNIRKRRVKMQLKKALESSLLAWENGRGNDDKPALASGN